ncbi:MAG: hypothetical protein SH850_02910 [Planctomycetaceae bacterium]|nr:hypothetical protein [Planctomycetaceae bacterium]
MHWKYPVLGGSLLAAMALAGCQSSVPPSGTVDAGQDGQIQATLAKLDAPDRAVAEQQRFCAVQTHERLGSMGVPLKLDVQGQPVFVCCKGCEKKALGNPDETLARVAALKASHKPSN